MREKSNFAEIESTRGAAIRMSAHRTLVTLVFFVVLIGTLAITSGSAVALKTHPFVSSVPIPGFEPIPAGVAVNESTHHVYVVSNPANSRGLIYNYTDSGELDSAHPTLTGASTLKPPPLPGTTSMINCVCFQYSNCGALM